ncbi:MAG: hypothetical protein Ct9H90mP13_11110 [Pseudomonadota bacterium]|nr:MAG: hypothetical protein Ct9H90mP13_11110 [Pseudomonadota bacterium]
MKTIVFLCVENSCRSQMAEAFGKMIGADRYQFFSAGSKPSGKVNPKAIKFMSDIGYDMSDHQSKGIDSLPQEGGNRNGINGLWRRMPSDTCIDSIGMGNP